MARRSTRTKTAERTARYRQRLAERHVPEAAAVDAAILSALAVEARAAAEKAVAVDVSESDRAVGELIVRIMTTAATNLSTLGFDHTASALRVKRRLRRPPKRREASRVSAQ